TLEEVRTADLLLHVTDASSPDREAHVRVVEQVLEEIGAGEIPAVQVWNKVDVLPPGEARIGRAGDFRVSAKRGIGIDELLRALDEKLVGDQERLAIDVPQSRSDLLAELYRGGRVLEQHFVDGVVRVTAVVPHKLAGRVRKALATSA